MSPIGGLPKGSAPLGARKKTIPFIFFRHNFYEIIRKKLGMSPIGGLPKGSAPLGLGKLKNKNILLGYCVNKP